MITSVTIDNEQQLIRNILEGNISAFTHIINAYQHKVHAFVNKRCSNSTDCDDIVQEVFIAIHKNLHQYKPEFPFKAWIFGIVRNKTNEHFRKVLKIPSPVEEAYDQSHSDTPEKRVFIAEESNLFWDEAKHILTEEQFTAIWLKYQQTLTISEICEHMNITNSNAKIHLFRARKKLSLSPLIKQLSP